MSDNNIKSRIAILDWAFLFSILILLLMVYIPNYIWSQEKEDRDESRFRMKTIANAAEFYKELTGNYTDDGDRMFALVEGAIDSLYADSLFIGSKQIVINNLVYDVVIGKGFDYRADTTFSVPVPIKKTVIDTVYWVLEYANFGKSKIDTNYINSNYLEERKRTYRNKDDNEKLKEDLDKLEPEKKAEYYKIYIQNIDTVYKKREIIVNNYMKRKYHLTSNLLSCPLTEKKYILDVRYDPVMGETFTVSSPVKKTDSKTMFYLFEYNPGNHGYISAGVPSWAE